MAALVIAVTAVLGANELLWRRGEFVFSELIKLTLWPGEIVALIGGGGLAVLTMFVAIFATRILNGGTEMAAIRRLGLLKINRRQLLAGGIMAGIMLALDFGKAIYLRLDVDWGHLVLVQAVTVFFAFILHEEVIFRGFVFGEIRPRTSFIVAAVISSAFFGLWHWQSALESYRNGHQLVALVQVGTPFLAGFPLAWMYERGGGSIWGPVAAHFGQAIHQVFHFNFTSLTPLWLGRHFWLVLPFIEVAVLFLVAFWFYPPRKRIRGEYKEV